MDFNAPRPGHRPRLAVLLAFSGAALDIATMVDVVSVEKGIVLESFSLESYSTYGWLNCRSPYAMTVWLLKGSNQELFIANIGHIVFLINYVNEILL